MNKGQLRAHFLALLNRTDCSNALADTFIEQAISRAQRTLRIPPMEKTITYSIVSPTTYLTIPADFLEIIDVYYGSTNMVRVPLSTLVEYKANTEAGAPRYFSREGSEFLIYPYPDSGTVTMNYYSQFDEMVLDTDENDLAIIGSDIITYGALAYASDYFLDERGILFEQKFQQFMLELQQQANDAETAGTVQSILPVANY